MENEFSSVTAFMDELRTMKKFAEFYNRLLRPEENSNKEVRTALIRLNVLEISTAYPFLLATYDALQEGQVSQSEFLEVLKILENYVVRRYLAGEATNYMNKMFPVLWKEINPAQITTSLKEALVARRYPSDERLIQTLSTEEFYGRNAQVRDKTKLILETINRRLSAGSGGYTVLDADATIEHLMPQKLGQEWKDVLGANWAQVHQELLHTIGNLTLVTQEWNSDLSNAPFAEKRAKLMEHALRLNKDYFNSISYWNEEAIKQRATFLAGKIIEIWPMLAKIPTSLANAGRKPKALLLMGQTIPVSSWREAVYQTALQISQVADDFETIAAQMPSYFDKQEFKAACRQLPNCQGSRHRRHFWVTTS